MKVAKDPGGIAIPHLGGRDKSWVSHKMWLIACAIVVSATNAGCGRRTDDEAVLTAALAYLSKELDRRSIGSQGILLLQPETLTWTNEDRAALRDNSPEPCII